MISWVSLGAQFMRPCATSKQKSLVNYLLGLEYNKKGNINAIQKSILLKERTIFAIFFCNYFKDYICHTVF